VTILAARAAGSGHALGADFSRIQVVEARRLAAAAGAANARFEVADVQVHPFGTGIFDVVLSSFGVMFFDDPAAAFGNLRKALRRGGRLAFLCWRTREENLRVPITSPTSCHQAIFVDQATDLSPSSDAVQVKVDRLG
jgi:ubiquinone/menaquinone biosynthesis C-methylase UbiE